MSIPLPPRPVVRKRVVKAGENFHVRLDGLTTSRCTHLGHLSREVLGVDTNLSGVIRTAIAELIKAIDADLKKLATMPDGEKKDHLLRRLRYQFEAGTKAYESPHLSLKDVLDTITGPGLEAWVTFPELCKRHKRPMPPAGSQRRGPALPLGPLHNAVRAYMDEHGDE